MPFLISQVVPASQRRKKIRKVMSKGELQKSTKEAEKEEEERKRRVLEKQKLVGFVLMLLLVCIF
jgi:hypothetical protein